MLFNMNPRSIFRRVFGSSKPVTKTPVAARKSPEPATLEPIATADRSSAESSPAKPSASQTKADPPKLFGRQAVSDVDKAELRMFERRFGRESGCVYFANGLTLHEAYLRHIEKLQPDPTNAIEGNSPLSALCEKLEQDIHSGLIQP